MGLSTHVLDTMMGVPASGMTVSLYTTSGGNATLVMQFTLNSDGRNPGVARTCRQEKSSESLAPKLRLYPKVANTVRPSSW